MFLLQVWTFYILKSQLKKNQYLVPNCITVLARVSFMATNLCDSRQYTEPSPQQSMTPLLAELMTLKQLGGGCNWNISLKLQDKSTLLQPPAPPSDVCLSSALLGCTWELFEPFWDQREAALPHRLTVGLPSLRESLASFLSWRHRVEFTRGWFNSFTAVRCQ